MLSFKNHPLFCAVLLLLLGMLGAEGWLWWQGRAPLHRALAALAQKQQERDELAHQSPALSAENEQAMVRDLANAREVRAKLRAGLQGTAPTLLAAAPPAKSIDLYFDLAAFVEKTRTLAARARVAVRPDERFGFTTHANAGPDPDLVQAVFRQRVISQYLVEALLEAHPRSLLAVQREPPLTAAQRAQRNQPEADGAGNASPKTPTPAGAGDAAADFFDFDPRDSVRVPGLVDSDAFRLEFTGQTPALRSFLNTLATFKLPVIVRRVEVEPVTAGLPAVDPAPPSRAVAAPVPVVAQNLSRFTVVVECIVHSPTAGPPAS